MTDVELTALAQRLLDVAIQAHASPYSVDGWCRVWTLANSVKQMIPDVYHVQALDELVRLGLLETYCAHDVPTVVNSWYRATDAALERTHS